MQLLHAMRYKRFWVDRGHLNRHGPCIFDREADNDQTITKSD